MEEEIKKDPIPEEKKVEESTVSKNENEKACAILSYLFIGIIWYLLDEKLKNNTLVKFHVKQSLVLIIFSIIINIVGTMLPVIGWFIILPLGSLLVFILAILGIINALNGKEKELPFVGSYAKHFTF